MALCVVEVVGGVTYIFTFPFLISALFHSFLSITYPLPKSQPCNNFYFDLQKMLSNVVF